jgi:hypothetical protein
MIVAAAPLGDALEGGGLPAAAVDGDGDLPAGGASGLLAHGTVYGTGGLKACTVYGSTMDRYTQPACTACTWTGKTYAPGVEDTRRAQLAADRHAKQAHGDNNRPNFLRYRAGGQLVLVELRRIQERA